MQVSNGDLVGLYLRHGDNQFRHLREQKGTGWKVLNACMRQSSVHQYIYCMSGALRCRRAQVIDMR